MTLWQITVIFDDEDEMLKMEKMSLWAVDKLDVIISIGFIYSKTGSHLRSVIFELDSECET